MKVYVTVVPTGENEGTEEENGSVKDLDYWDKQIVSTLNVNGYASAKIEKHRPSELTLHVSVKHDNSRVRIVLGHTESDPTIIGGVNVGGENIKIAVPLKDALKAFWKALDIASDGNLTRAK